MTDKTPQHIKLDECNHVEKNLLFHLDSPGRSIIALMQDLHTGKKRVTPLLESEKEATA